MQFPLTAYRQKTRNRTVNPGKATGKCQESPQSMWQFSCVFSVIFNLSLQSALALRYVKFSHHLKKHTIDSLNHYRN